MRTITIYGLFHPETLECFYIGQTSNPAGRASAHRRKFAHINPLLFAPIETTIDIMHATDREAHWIIKLRAAGDPITNCKLPRKPLRRAYT